MTDPISQIAAEISAELTRLRRNGTPIGHLENGDISPEGIARLLLGVDSHVCGDGEDFFEPSVREEWLKQHCTAPKQLPVLSLPLDTESRRSRPHTPPPRMEEYMHASDLGSCADLDEDDPVETRYHNWLGRRRNQDDSGHSKSPTRTRAHRRRTKHSSPRKRRVKK